MFEACLVLLAALLLRVSQALSAFIAFSGREGPSGSAQFQGLPGGVYLSASGASLQDGIFWRKLLHQKWAWDGGGGLGCCSCRLLPPVSTCGLHLLLESTVLYMGGASASHHRKHKQGHPDYLAAMRALAC